MYIQFGVALFHFMLSIAFFSYFPKGIEAMAVDRCDIEKK